MIKWPEEVNQFIRDNVRGRTTKELSALLNANFDMQFTPQQVKCAKNRLKVQSGTKCGNPVGYSTVYPEDMLAFVQANAKGKTTRELTDLVNEKYGAGTITERKMRAYKKNHDIVSGVDGRFKKGCLSWNKGKKQTDYMNPEAIERTKITRFKKGHTPDNLLPIGTKRKTKDGYWIIKVQSKGTQRERWRMLHHVVWEAHHGKIKRGQAVIFLDGNTDNVTLGNLALISLKENQRLNIKKWRFLNAELTETAINLTRLMEACKEAKNRERKDGRGAEADSPSEK